MRAFERESFGALHQMMSTLSDAERDETWKEIERELRKFETAGGFVGPCEMLVGVGQALGITHWLFAGVFPARRRRATLTGGAGCTGVAGVPVGVVGGTAGLLGTTTPGASGISST